ncbi:6-phosphogluconate dehydrogenase [uncultured Tenacibaculum sp.]|uniref:6-phosphogluconate dehydrogenase n=1 Tax=uncultured Tenacibaculum sp. TaxID=174713 RepID=UPI00262ED241|nr:6-phosphogluconate dehydrogenase [uncultured Tenacibaculum sp.]
MKKILFTILSVILLLAVAYYTFIYYVPYSEGVRSGELIKFSRKGITIKTWEGEISQGISGAQIFSFSVEDKEKEAIKNLKKYQGRYVKLTYKERFGKFFWLGDTKYFITKVEEENSPHFSGLRSKKDE